MTMTTDTDKTALALRVAEAYTSFPHPNISTGWKCCFCKTSADRPVVLVPVEATDDPNIWRAEQVHEACWKLVMEMEDASHD